MSLVSRSGAYRSASRLRTTSFLDLLRRRYSGFLSSSRPEFELQVDLTPARPPSDDDVRVRRERNNTNGEWILERGDFRVHWNPVTGRGRVRQNSNPYSLDSVLRILHSLILAERGGFLLHAASAICDGQAFLFSGVSGAGKTTMTRLAPSEITLCSPTKSLTCAQTLAVIRHSARLSRESWPDPVKTARRRSPLFFSWSKVPRTASQELSSAEAVRRLMRNILFFAEDRGTGGKAFCHCVRFCRHGSDSSLDVLS